MLSSTGYNAYKTNNANLASPQELTLMLYNGALKFCTISIQEMENKHWDKSNTANKRVQDIIDELRVTLNRSYPIALEMDTLYAYILELLVDGNIKKDVAKMEEAKKLITEFRDTWKELIGK